MVAKSKGSNKAELLFRFGKDVPKWYEIYKTLPTTKSSTSIYNKQTCEQFYQSECELYQKIHQEQQGSDYQWLQTSLSTTAKDRLAALVTLIRRSPIHSIKELNGLVQSLQDNIQHRRDALNISEILNDVFISIYLPENRRLLSFEQQTEQVHTKSIGILFVVEDKIKQLYLKYIDLLQQIAHDPIGAIRFKAVSRLQTLLSQRPEQEKHLLELIVDKLGDPDSTVAAKTLHLLSQLLEQHPGMKTVLVNEVERLLFRKNIRSSAQHYGLCCLANITFTSQDNDLANKLIRIYFALFRSVSVQENVSSKFFAILLGGVTRAISFTQVDLENIVEHLNDLFRIVHCSNFKTSVRALQLLYRISEQRSEIDDRYYNALYKKISEPDWKNSKMLSTFLNLIFKSMLKDVMDARIRAFIKRLLQLCLYNDVPFVCGILLLLSELVKRHSNGSSLLLFSQKSKQLGNDKNANEDDEEEHFHDVDNDKNEQTEENISQPLSSWNHKLLKKSHEIRLDHYDLYKRNPLYCGSDLTCLHELLLLKNHSHPTVALFAQQLFEGESIEYDGNPLIDFNSMRFFDRFIYKNPKKQIEKHEKLREKSRHVLSRTYLPRGVKAVAVDSNEYLKINPNNIPADERFLYTFMKMRKENSDLAETRKKSKSTDEIDDNESIESVSDDEFDTYLDQFMGDADKDEIDLADKTETTDIASTVQMSSRSIDPTSMDENDVDEISDDDPIDDQSEETLKNQHIRDNFKVDNEREIKQIKWEMDREQVFKKRAQRYERNMKKTSRRKPKLTRRQKRQQLHSNQTNLAKKKKKVRFS